MGLRWVVFKIWYILWNCQIENWGDIFPILTHIKWLKLPPTSSKMLWIFCAVG